MITEQGYECLESHPYNVSRVARWRHAISLAKFDTSTESTNKIIFKPDEINSTSYKNLEVKDYFQLNESTLQYLDACYLCYTCEDHIAFYKMEKTTASIPVVTESIRIDAKLHVQLYFKGCPLPLPPWFREGRNCKLTSLTQLENFPSEQRHNSYLTQFPKNYNTDDSWRKDIIPLHWFDMLNASIHFATVL